MSLGTFFAKRSTWQSVAAIAFGAITLFMLFGQLTGGFPITDFSPSLISQSPVVSWIVTILLVAFYLFLFWKGFIQKQNGPGSTWNRRDDEWPNNRK